MSRKVCRPNPLLSFTISQKEYEELVKLAEMRGVSIAQIGRGFFKDGVRKYYELDYIQREAKRSEIVRLGVF